VFAAKPAVSIDGAASLTVREKSGFAVRRYTSAPPRLCVRNFFPNFRPAIGILLKPFPSRLSHRAWRC
jgi:hypothetical protein